MRSQLVDRKGPYHKGLRAGKFFGSKKDIILKKIKSTSRYTRNFEKMSKLRSKFDAYPYKEYAVYYSIFILFAIFIGLNL